MENVQIKKVVENDADFLFQLMNTPAIMRALNETPTQISDWDKAIVN